MSQTPQSVADLFRQYLHRQIAAHAQGLGFADADGQVVPHEAAPVQPVDPRLAWENAFAAVRYFPRGCVEPQWEAPPSWPVLVTAQEPAVAVAFCIGNFPQMVRNLQPLLHGSDLTALSQTLNRPSAVPPALLEWIKEAHNYPHVLLAAAVLRLCRCFDEAKELLKSAGRTPPIWHPVRANEEAALAWHRGQAEEARVSWGAQKASVPVLFNRGMAALFLGDAAEAQISLTEAVAQLPEMSPWHHLGRLYLALAAAA